MVCVINIDLTNLTFKKIKTIFLGHGVITQKSVRDAMLAVDRGYFAPNNPYEDSPQSIGSGVTISAPVGILSPKLKKISLILYNLSICMLMLWKFFMIS